MNVGTEKVCEALEETVQRGANILVAWRDLRIDWVLSIAGTLQIYSDKSQISLSAGALDFCTLHITYVNFTENCRISHISTGRSIVAYLPVKFHGEGVGLSAEGKKSSFSRLNLLSAYHGSVEETLLQLSNSAIIGLSVRTSDRARL